VELRRIRVDDGDFVFYGGEVLGPIPTLNVVDYTAPSKESCEFFHQPLSRSFIGGIKPDGQIDFNAKTP